MKSVFLLLICISLSSPLRATMQEPEQLIYEGRTNQMWILHYEKFPLTLYCASNQCPELRRYKLFYTTDNYRGYQGSWEIISNRLYLVNITGWIQERPAKLSDIFNKKQILNNKVPAIWYSGVFNFYTYDQKLKRYIAYKARIKNGKVERIRSIKDPYND